MNLSTSDNFTKVDSDANVRMAERILVPIALTLGIPGIISNVLVAYLKLRYKKDFDGPTYSYMIQLAIADVFGLICVSIGTSVFILNPNLIYEDSTELENFFAFSLNLGWHPACCLFCLIAYSRYITLCKNELLPEYFSKRRIRLSICLSWATGVLYAFQFSHREHKGRLTRWFPEKLSWGNDIEYGFSGKFFLIITMMLSFSTLFFIGYYDLRVVIWLHKNRRSITTIDNSRMLKREIKLFLQCLITSCFFMGVFCTYMVLNVLIADSLRSIWLYLLMDVSWLLNHGINPLIYYILNKKLRSYVHMLINYKAITIQSTTTTVRPM